MTQQPTYKIRNWTATVHFSNDGETPACGPIKTHKCWASITRNQVTCQKCIAKYGEDHDHGDDPIDPIIAMREQRAAERAARQAARRATEVA